MNSEDFETTVDEQLNRSRDMLFSKNAHYNPNADKLRGFKATATLRNTTPQGALAGMMVKHTLSVYDMCESGQEYPIEVWNEKISDHINYLLLLRAVVEEQRGEKVDEGDEGDDSIVSVNSLTDDNFYKEYHKLLEMHVGEGFTLKSDEARFNKLRDILFPRAVGSSQL